jgi:hypothetical protein
MGFSDGYDEEGHQKCYAEGFDAGLKEAVREEQN